MGGSCIFLFQTKLISTVQLNFTSVSADKNKYSGQLLFGVFFLLRVNKGEIIIFYIKIWFYEFSMSLIFFFHVRKRFSTLIILKMNIKTKNEISVV